jgi:hypothetical protein
MANLTGTGRISRKEYKTIGQEPALILTIPIPQRKDRNGNPQHAYLEIAAWGETARRWDELFLVDKLVDRDGELEVRAYVKDRKQPFGAGLALTLINRPRVRFAMQNRSLQALRLAVADHDIDLTAYYDRVAQGERAPRLGTAPIQVPATTDAPF